MCVCVCVMVLPITVCLPFCQRKRRQHICLDIGTNTRTLLHMPTGEQRQFWSLEVSELNSEPDCLFGSQKRKKKNKQKTTEGQLNSYN